MPDVKGGSEYSQIEQAEYLSWKNDVQNYLF